MQHLAPRRIPNVVFGLSIFWSIIFSAFFWDMDSNFSFLLPWLICILVGIWLAQSSSEAYVQNILKSLKYRSDLQLPVAAKGAFFNEMGGISSTLGPIPFPNRALAGASSCDFSELKAHAPAELAGDATLAGVLGYYLGPTGRDRHPAHVALFDAIARIFLHPSHVNCPAGIDKHGGRTLLSHSLLVCALMVHRAPSYLYRATRLKAINPHYKLDPLDPLLPVIGLAHDIGKLRAFIFDEHGNVCGIDPGHETEGSRIMALVHEFWDERIDIEERRVLQTVLAYYHREHSIPVQKNEQIERPQSHRTVCMP